MTNKTTHYVIDEELSGGTTTVYREYVEVDREAEVGDYFVSLDELNGITNGGVYLVESLSYDSIQHGYIGRRFFDDDDRERAVWSPHKYKTLKPTGVVRINGKRYRLADRRAEVGESIINKCDDIVVEVTSVGEEGAYTYTFEVKDGDVCFGMEHGYYYVLEPLEGTTPQDDAQTLIANLASEVARLKREVAGLNRLTETHQSTIMQLLDHVDSNHKDIVKQAEEFAELTERVKTLEAQELVIDGEEIAEHLLTEVLMRERGTK